MKQIRHSVFETNSSSTHSLTMCTKHEYNEYIAKRMVINEHSGSKYVEIWKDYPELITLSQLREIAKKLTVAYPDEADYEQDWDSMSDNALIETFAYDGFGDIKTVDDEVEYLESFYSEYTTSGGETVVAFGEFGYDG